MDTHMKRDDQEIACFETWTSIVNECEQQSNLNIRLSYKSIPCFPSRGFVM